MAIKIAPIHTVQPDMPLTTALSMLLEAEISALPVVDATGVLPVSYTHLTLPTKA